MSNLPTWPEVVARMEEILEQPTDVPQYIGSYKHYKIDRGDWDQLDRVCAFVLRMVYARTRFEDAENKKRYPGFAKGPEDFTVMSGGGAGLGATYSQWGQVGRWAAAHLLFAMLSRFQDQYAKDFVRDHPKLYTREYRAAERKGGVNPVVVPPRGLDLEAYAQRLARSSTSYIGWWLSYFKSIP